MNVGGVRALSEPNKWCPTSIFWTFVTASTVPARFVMLGM